MRKKIDEIFGSQRYNKADSVYGFDKSGNVINADQYDNRDFSIYAFEDGETTPVFEFTGGNFKNIHYSQREKMFRFYDENGKQDKDMRMYHLDKDGNRDSLVDPTTGIAYLVESIEKKDSHDNIHGTNDDFNSDKDVKIFVWPVNTFYDGTGNADDNTKGSHYFQKIITTRPATINADTADEYVFGTLKDGKFENTLNRYWIKTDTRYTTAFPRRHTQKAPINTITMMKSIWDTSMKTDWMTGMKMPTSSTNTVTCIMEIKTTHSIRRHITSIPIDRQLK